MPDDLSLTDTQRKILEALCRPASGANRFAPPATNQEIADELFLSVDAIKAHLRVLFRKFGIEDLPHNQKRARLVELAVDRGIVDCEGEGVGSGEPPAHPLPSASPERLARKQGRRPPGRLIAAGIAVGAVAVAILAIVLISGRGGGGDSSTRAEVVAAIKSSCTQGIEAAGAVPKGAAPDPANTLSAISIVRVGVDEVGAPSDDPRGFDQFSKGLDQ